MDNKEDFNASAASNNLARWPGFARSQLPKHLMSAGYQPFSRDNRIGKICDWTVPASTNNNAASSYALSCSVPGNYALPCGYYGQSPDCHDGDDSSFHLVDYTREQKPWSQRGRFGHQNQRIRGFGGGRGGLHQALGKLSLHERDRNGQISRGARQQDFRTIKKPEASVAVGLDWVIIQEMEFSQLSKLTLPNVKEGEDITCCGSLEFYDKSYNKVNLKNSKPLQRDDRFFQAATTTEDPVIRKLSKIEGNVYATDTILATIMCCTRSNYSWDIVVEKIGNKIFFDKRDSFEFDLLTVDETSVKPPQDDGNFLNFRRNLSLEATFLNHNFSQQVLKSSEPRYKFDEPNPFLNGEKESEVASIAYRYRKWNLGNGIILIARCELDAVMRGPNNEIQFLTIKALNEWDSKLAKGVEWRQKLGTQRGAVLANEMRNNACKLAKWTVQALLAGSNHLKLGYVSRANPRDCRKHDILEMQQFKPNEFANQINLNMDNAWGILRCIIDLCMKQKDGKYLIMKDPNKSMIRLYDIQDNAFESEEEDVDDDEKVMRMVFGVKKQYKYNKS